MRDENGFKMHTQSESHVRQMLLVGEDPKKYINDYSSQFQRDFLQLLRTAHGEKKVHLNHFYQEYIGNKEHVHMNATRWPSLTEFAKFLGREGICRVEEDDKGIHVAWIDNSPEALRRQDAIRKKERQDRGDEEREQALIRAQVRRAQQDAEARGDAEVDEAGGELQRAEGEKIKLSFGAKPAPSKGESSSMPSGGSNHPQSDPPPLADSTVSGVSTEHDESTAPTEIAGSAKVPGAEVDSTSKAPVKMSFQSKPKNVFAAAKKNALGGGKKAAIIEHPKKMSAAERIMKEELERKRNRGPNAVGAPAAKKQRF
jgi:DNA/RNA-binding protein KIN17